jgi:hypothetical protein
MAPEPHTRRVKAVYLRHRVLAIGLLWWLVIAALILLFHKVDGAGPV